MKILFIVPSTGYYRSGLSNPLGPLSVATYLKANGYEVRLYDRNVDNEKTASVIKSFRPDIVGVSIVSSRGLKDAVKVSKMVKKQGITVVWGGQIPTMNTDICLQCGAVDYIIMGEGELTWLELAQKMDKGLPLGDMAGIAYTEKGEIVITRYREFADLKDLPAIDWTIAKPETYYQKYIYNDMLYLFASKGCPYNCAFCGNLEYHRCTYRKRPVDMTLDEIEQLVLHHQLKAVYFTDELWCADKRDAVEFCKKVTERNLKFFWGCDTRVDHFNNDELQMMYDAGCRWLLFGGESGSELTLQKINKGLKASGAEQAVDYCRKIGIAPIVTLVVGFPGETRQEVMETVKLGLRIKTKFVLVFHYFPTPGSDLYRELVDSGQYIPPKNIKQLYGQVAMESVGQNLSQIPSAHLRVIRCFFLWAAFTQRGSFDPDNKKTLAFARETISDFINAVTKKGIKYFFNGAISAAAEFIYILWHVIAYPGIRKKYGLYQRNKQG